MKLAETDSPIAECSCWRCGHLFDAATCVNQDKKPRPGDASICVECGELGVYDKKLRVRKPTPAQRKKFAADPDVREAQMHIRLAAAIFRSHRVGHA